MGELLPSKDAPQLIDENEPAIEKLADRAINFHENIIYFPVRHHSPVCSFHLKNVISEYAPECILVEGPENANALIDVLTNSESKAPFAIYYSFSDKSGIVSESCEDYKCYYPFMDYSPELVALREAKKLGIKAEFIDLPYREILAASSEGSGLRDKSLSYNDDYMIARSKYICEICERTGCRNFDELWEKYFEQNGYYFSAKDFVRQMLTYCFFSRKDTLCEEMMADGCLAREAYMAQRISQAQDKYRRILVVTGGFHTCALVNYSEKHDIKFHKVGKGEEYVYPMAYTMEAVDSLSGYASGMPAPAFYQMIWNQIEEGISAKETYKNTVLNFLVSVGRKIRAKGENISTFDETCAFDMANGLAELRNKISAGLFELRDCVLSCYVKGEVNLSESMTLKILTEATTGDKRGRLCSYASIPPIVTDFETQCSKFGIKTGTSLSKEMVLNIFSSVRHRETSQFFYRMCFLEVDFAVKIRGANLHTGRDKNLIRETWKYKWNAEVSSELIDRSVYGGTIREACVNIINVKLGKSNTAGECAELMVSAFEMGLSDESDSMVRITDAKITNDGNFISLADALNAMCRLVNLRELYNAQHTADLTPLIKKCSGKLVSLMPSMADVNDDDCDACSRACRQLYSLSSRKILSEYREEIISAFRRTVKQNPINPCLQGTVYGLIYGSDASVKDEITKVCKGYFTGTPNQLGNGTGFLRGLFSTARDLVFVEDSFIKMIDGLLVEIDDDTFMNIVPELRMAFAYFSPGETDRIAESVASMHGCKSRDITEKRGITPKLYKIGENIDKWTERQMSREDVPQ